MRSLHQMAMYRLGQPLRINRVDVSRCMENSVHKRVVTLGRPRSQELDDVIIQAATRLIRDLSYAEVTMEAVASKAGVSKATVYRRWPNKAALTVDVLLRQALVMQVPFQGAYREHLIRGMLGLREMLSSVFAEAIVSVIVETQKNEALRGHFYSGFISKMQAIGDANLELAIERGEVRADISKDMIFDQIFGTFYYRLLVVHKPIDDAYIEQIVDNVIRQIE